LTSENNNSSQNGFSRNRIAFLFVIITAGFLIFVGTIIYLSLTERRVPKLISKETNNATRGEIVSSDGYTIARSKKIYKAQLDTRNIDPDKKELPPGRRIIFGKRTPPAALYFSELPA